MSAGSVWAPVVSRLEGFRCIVLDRPGCGLSAASATDLHDIAALEAYADALLVELLDALAIERADIVATSFGGYFALRALASHPDRFGRLVEMGFPFGAPMLRMPLLMRISSIPAMSKLAIRMPINERTVRTMLRQAGLRGALESGRFDQAALDWYLSLLRDTDTMRNEVGVAPLVILPIRGVNTRVLLTPELLATITAPVNFLWGEDDPFGGTDTAQHFAGQLAQSHLEMLPGAGHAPWVDDPDRAAAVIGDAFADLPRS